MDSEKRCKMIDFLIEREDAPFEWGKNDCFLMMADAVKEVHGIDPGDKIRGQYDSRDSAYSFLNKLTGEDFLDKIGIILERLGFVAVKDFDFGDVACVAVENIDPKARKLFGGVTFGIVCSDTMVACQSKDGVGFTDQFEFVKVWRYGKA